VTTVRLAASTASATRPRRTAVSTGLTPAQLVLAKRMPEQGSPDALLESCIDLIHRRRLVVAHFRPAFSAAKGGRWITPVAGDGKGFPDLVISGGRWLMVRELKSWAGRVAAEQRVWLDAMTQSGVDVDVWTPLEWFNGTITRELDEVAW
jgi:hypothetical protein